MLFAWIEIVTPQTVNLIDASHRLNPLHKKMFRLCDICRKHRDLQSRLRDVSVFLLRFSQTNYPIESDNVQRDRFRLRGHGIESLPREFYAV